MTPPEITNKILLERIHALEKQVGILVALMESEKGNITHLITDAVLAIREHGKKDDEEFAKLDKRIGVLERMCYIAIGGVALIEIIVRFI